MIHTGDIDKKGTTDIKKQSSPKSPYPPNSMSESVAHIVGNASDIKDLKEGLKQEIVDRKDGDQQLADDIASIEQVFPILDEAIQNLEESDEKLQSNIDAEKERATKRENEIEDSIDAETARATSREDELEKAIGEAGKIDDVKVDGTSVVTDKVANIDLQPIRDSISAEETRAKAAEDKLAADLSAEATARKSADETLQTSINAERTTRASVDNSLQVNIDAEAKRRKEADSSNLIEAKKYTDAKTALPRIKIEKSQLISDTTASLTEEQYKIFTDTNNDAVVVDLSAINYPVLIFHKITEELPLITSASLVAEMPQKELFDTSVSNVTKLCITVNVDDSSSDIGYYARISDVTNALYSELSDEVSARKTNDETLQSNIEAEASARETNDSTLQANITAEVNRAKAAEKSIADDLTAEASTRQADDETLQSNIDSEAARAKNAEQSMDAALSTETSERKSADEALQSNIDAEAKARCDMDDSLGIQIAFQTQRAESAIGSLRTTMTDEISDREAADSALQTSIDAEVSARKAADESLQSGIDSINSKIPEQASPSNQLADKDYVNSSIATSTATFRGTVDSLDALKALTGDLNDYAFVEVKDETTGLTLRYDRYKYSDAVSAEAGNWTFEYTLNNSSFTSDQWKAITSGITSDLVAQITTNKDAIAQEISRATSKETELEDAISKAGKVDDVQVNGASVVTDKVANIDLTDYVTLSTDQTITGLKTFAAPAYVSVEQATAIYNTSNGGRIIFGKSGANSGTMIAVEQKAGTRRLNFRASVDSSAMVWEQPESSSNLYFDVAAVHFRKGTSITFGENAAYKQAIFFKQLTSADYLYTDSKGTLTKGTFDDAPTADSTNPVTSGGIKSYVDSSASDTLTASKAYTDQEKANYVQKSGDTMTGTLNVPTINSMNTSTAVSINVGTHASSYFQARKFRGQGDANTYNHAVDFGYAGHDRIDFYEYGGVFNFWANRSTSKLEGDGNRVASLQSGKILERGNTLAYPGKSGTFALTVDVTDGDAQTLTDAKVYVDQQISVIEIDGGEVSQ